MDFLAEHVWLCGSPETIVKKLEDTVERAGGFGTVCMNTHDSIERLVLRARGRRVIRWRCRSPV